MIRSLPSVVVLMMRRRAITDDDAVSDEALLSGVAVGDDRAALVFVRRYQRRLFGLALGVVGDLSLAEDIAQEAFLRIFRHAVMFDARRGTVASWSLTITRNLAIDALRTRHSTPTEPAAPIFMELLSTEHQPEELAVIADDLSFVRIALAGLPVEQRRAVLLAAMFGRTASEIARLEDIPIGTAKSRIRLGMDKLRDRVQAKEIP